MRTASKGMHYLLYALLVAQAGLGWTIGWAAGHPIHFFGIGIPGPFDAFDRPLRHELREIHEKVGWAIIILAGVHALAALYHHYFLRDRVLRRMLPVAR
jgi:cytochrome b561